MKLDSPSREMAIGLMVIFDLMNNGIKILLRKLGIKSKSESNQLDFEFLVNTC